MGRGIVRETLRRGTTAIVVIGVLMTASGCHVLHHKHDGDALITPGTKLPRPSESIGQIEGRNKSFFLLFGLFPMNNNSGPQYAVELAREQFGDEFDGITNLRMSEQMDAVDVIVNTLFGIVFSMMTTEVEGDVHKYTGSRR